MAIEPRPEKNKANKPLLDHNIVTVERAAGELRRGLPVVISDGQDVILMQSAELLTDTWIDRFQDLTETPPVIGLTYHRANILRVLPRGGDVALIKLSEHMIEYGAAAMIQSMADPADDLRQPMKGPFHVADQDAGKIHAAGLKLCKIAKLLPAALFSGLIPTEDGPHWAAQKGLLQASASDILVFDHRDGQALRFVTSARVPLAGAAKTTMVAYRPDDGGTEHFALIIGDPNRHDPVLTRVHSECFTGDLLGSLKCDCGDQLNGAIKHMQNAGGGVLLYLAQEGRGIGLTNKRLFAITGSHCINHVFRAEHGGITALPCAQENAAGALNRDFLHHGLSKLAEFAAFHLPAAGAGNFGEFTPALLGKAGILKKHLVRRLG